MSNKIKSIIITLFAFILLGLLTPIFVNKTELKSEAALKTQRKPPRPPKPIKHTHLFFEGVPIIKGNSLANKDTLLKNGYIYSTYSVLNRKRFAQAKNFGKKFDTENKQIKIKFLAEQKLYLEVYSNGEHLNSDANMLIYNKTQYIKIKQNETYQTIFSDIKIRVENFNTEFFKNLIQKQSSFNLKDWSLDATNSSFFNNNDKRYYSNFFQENDIDVRQSKFISFKKGNEYLFFFFNLDTNNFDANKLKKISLNEDVFSDTDKHILNDNFQKYIPGFCLLKETDAKSIDFNKSVLKYFARENKKFLLIVYENNFKIIELNIGTLNDKLKSFTEFMEFECKQKFSLFSKDKLDFTVLEIKNIFKKFTENFDLNYSDVLKQLNDLKTADEEINLSFFAKNNPNKPIVKTIKIKFKPAKEITNLTLTFKTNSNYFITDTSKLNNITSSEIRNKTFSQSTTTLSTTETTLFTEYGVETTEIIEALKKQICTTLTNQEYDVYYTQQETDCYLFAIKRLSTDEIRIFKVNIRRINKLPQIYDLEKLCVFNYYNHVHEINDILKQFYDKFSNLANLDLKIANQNELISEINKLKLSPYLPKKISLTLIDKYLNEYTLQFFAEARYGSSLPIKTFDNFVDSKHSKFFLSSNLSFANAIADLFNSYDLKDYKQTLKHWFDKESEQFKLKEFNNTIKVTYNFFKKDYFAQQINLNSYLLNLNNDLNYSEQDIYAIFRNIFGKNTLKIEKINENKYFIYLNNLQEKQTVLIKYGLDLVKYRVSSEVIQERISHFFKEISDTKKTAEKIEETLKKLLQTIPELTFEKENTENTTSIFKIYSTFDKKIYKTFTVLL